MIGKVRDLLGLEGLSYALYDHPDMVEDIVETCCLFVEDLLDQVLPALDFDFAAGWEDIAGRNGPLVSPDFLRAVVLPRYRRIHAKLAAAGVDVRYTDCDGDVRPLIPLFLEAGINCLFPFEVFCSGHPRDVLREFGTGLLMMGGMDKRVLTAGRPGIRHYLETLVPLVEAGGFIPFCDHRCPVNVDPADYLYYQDVKRELLGALKG
jgi:uroporphyrinogen decarboxylase